MLNLPALPVSLVRSVLLSIYCLGKVSHRSVSSYLGMPFPLALDSCQAPAGQGCSLLARTCQGEGEDEFLLHHLFPICVYTIILRGFLQIVGGICRGNQPEASSLRRSSQSMQRFHAIEKQSIVLPSYLPWQLPEWQDVMQ